ncbi:MAG: polysulfide reductase [Nitrospinota bacterium]|nr:MAG: polysulfide reductase [Nitrospinota bacterium]
MEGNKYSAEEYALLKPVMETGKGFYFLVTVLVLIILWAIYAYSYQLRYGLSVTGLNWPVFWGLYITNFVFFIGISHAGTLISAILRICRAEWRRSITRAAEVITVLVLFIGAGNVILDVGRPDRVLKVLTSGHLRSPLLWDVISISTYLTVSSIYLYLPLIPDIAILRDHGPQSRRWFYRILALGWQGTPKQHRYLEIGIAIMAVIVIPVAVSVHTVVSWVFAMTIQPMWHSTIFGPYFVAGAIFSGIAAIIIAMAIIRKAYHLEEYLKPVHFNNLGILLLVMTLLWFYFTFAEHLTTYYGAEPHELEVLYAKMTGRYAPYFWAMVIFNFVLPMILLSIRRLRTITGVVIASISVEIGMWLERFTIVVPTLVNPRLTYEPSLYRPTWVEWSLMAGCFALFFLLYLLFTKLFPIVSIWEIREGREKAFSEVKERFEEYFPRVSAQPGD